MSSLRMESGCNPLMRQVGSGCVALDADTAGTL